MERGQGRGDATTERKPRRRIIKRRPRVRISGWISREKRARRLHAPNELLVLSA